MLQRIFHTGFIVRDMRRSLAFYRDLLGLEVVREASDYSGEFADQLTGFQNVQLHIVFLSLGEGHQLELTQFLNPVGGKADIRNNDVGSFHVGIAVEDVQALADRLLGVGVTLRTMPTVERKNVRAPWARRGCFVQDPDGNWLELLEIAPE